MPIKVISAKLKQDYEREAIQIEEQLRREAPLLHWEVERAEERLKEQWEAEASPLSYFKIAAQVLVSGELLRAGCMLDRHLYTQETTEFSTGYILYLMTQSLAEEILNWRPARREEGIDAA